MFCSQLARLPLSGIDSCFVASSLACQLVTFENDGDEQEDELEQGWRIVFWGIHCGNAHGLVIQSCIDSATGRWVSHERKRFQTSGTNVRYMPGPWRGTPWIAIPQEPAGSVRVPCFRLSEKYSKQTYYSIYSVQCWKGNGPGDTVMQYVAGHVTRSDNAICRYVGSFLTSVLAGHGRTSHSNSTECTPQVTQPGHTRGHQRSALESLL